MNENNGHLLSVHDLRTYFDTDDGVVKAVDGVSFHIEPAETFALVGESGCGKSVTAFSIMGLVPCPPGRIASQRYLDRLGERQGKNPSAMARDMLAGGPSSVEFEGQALLELNEKQMRQVRGGRIGMIFQEPMSSLNPVFTCGSQIVEAIRLHRPTSGRQEKAQAIELLAQVGIAAPARRFGAYPHQLSGGMRQRVMIAMALSCNPKLLIADEPTTALDVTIQAQILELLSQLQDRTGLSIMLITHDLAVVAETAHRVAVMYASKIVELTDVGRLFATPLHPYTHGLFRSIPRLGEMKDRLDTIPGGVPNPLEFPTGCKFHPRCPVGRGKARCRMQEPPLRQVAGGHFCACWEAPGYDRKDAP